MAQPVLWLLAAGWAAVHASVLLRGQTLPEYVKLRESWLLPGWRVAIPVDRADLPGWNCWIDWRANFSSLAGLMAIFLLLRRLLVGSPVSQDGTRTPASRLYTLAAGLIWVVVLHGLGGALLLLALALANYKLTRHLCGSESSRARSGLLAMLAIWTANLAALLAMFWITAEDDGPGNGNRIQRLLDRSGRWPLWWLRFQGLGPWHSYRFTCLRFISFGCDAILAGHPEVLGRQSARQKSGDASLDFVNEITECPRPEEDYWDSVWLYISYVTYPPLYFAGPFLSFNAFAAQQERPAETHRARDIGELVLGLLGYSFALELLQHLFFYSAWVGSQAPVEVLLALPLVEIASAVHCLLNFEWMSLLVVWRFNRIISLLDGIDTYENMDMNINMVSSFQGLWRHWHASLNKFCVRYIYVPLGGSQHPLLGVVSTFFFVALWHEVNGAGTAFHWYTWAALNCCCVLFEKRLVSKLPRTGPLATMALGAATYLAMQFCQLHALMDWDVACAVSQRLAACWALGLPPLLHGLQRLADDSRRREAKKAASTSDDRNGRPLFGGA